MLTFSQMVDAVIDRTGRGDRAQDVAAYINQTVREVQTLAFFAHDLVEDIAYVTTSPVTWDPPAYFRTMRAVNYNGEIWPKFAQPGQIQDRYAAYYYRAGTYFVFNGAGLGTSIQMAYYSYAPRLLYYAEGARPATYDAENGVWNYLTAITLGDQEAARAKVSNWLIINHYDCIVEGALAKIYKSVGDQVRSATAFSLYKTMQAQLMASERTESLQYYASEGAKNG